MLKFVTLRYFSGCSPQTVQEAGRKAKSPAVSRDPQHVDGESRGAEGSQRSQGKFFVIVPQTLTQRKKISDMPALFCLN